VTYILRICSVRSRVGFLVGLALVAIGYAWAGGLSGQGSTVRAATASPIKHVVVIYQENHSFDNVLGAFCVSQHRCDGATSGRLASGQVIRLADATDVVPMVAHRSASQLTAIDGGHMDGFSRIRGCRAAAAHACYSQFQPSQIPNLRKLAARYALDDHTFELHYVPSWGAHLELVAGQLDGFMGDNPFPGTTSHTGPGWGCDSGMDTTWRATPGSPIRNEPSCVPMQSGSGPYRRSPVDWVPTIMDRLGAAGRSWSIYGPSDGFGYGWAICPTFADCLNTKQASHVKSDGAVITAAKAGTLPDLSIVIPTAANSQHNSESMARGDNWIGSVVSAIMHGPDWSSTAIFITYDDCGCFYDHVAPPAGLGIRVPMVIVSPYAKAGYTDTETASFASLLAFTEHTFGLKSLARSDTNAYDFTKAFNYAQAPLAPVTLTTTHIPPREARWLAAHPPSNKDPT
jgi:Phosphoesterase family